jgi:hypothetical protein
VLNILDNYSCSTRILKSCELKSSNIHAGLQLEAVAGAQTCMPSLGPRVCITSKFITAVYIPVLECTMYTMV